MKMQILSGGRLRMRKSIYFPSAEKAETFELPVSAILLRHPQGNVLFDTGCHPSIAENAETRWGGLAKLMVPVMKPGDNVLTGLKAVGLVPDDIDVVICSHLHTDHCGCNEFFKKATVMIHALELAAAKAPDAVDRGYLAADWDHPMPIKTVDGQTDVFGDDRIVLVPLPGHTPGTMGALVKLDNSGQFLLTSDALSVRGSLDQNIVPKNTWNAELCLKTFDDIRRIEKAGAIVICSHDAKQWETLRKGADAYD